MCAEQLRRDACTIITNVIADNQPDTLVKNALKSYDFNGNIYLVAIGKAGWVMARAATDVLDDRIKKGIVITKYNHSQGELPNIEIVEAGHPLPDENTLIGTDKVINMVSHLTQEDHVLFLVSGGGSALFEKPINGITLNDLANINRQLLSCGADIVEMNVIRKRLSSVKAGRFAELCSPAQIYAVVLSDVIGDRLDSIASGPATPDPFTLQDALAVIEKYGLKFSNRILTGLKKETPKTANNVESVIIGNVQILCESTARAVAALGYNPHILTARLDCEAKEAGRFIASLASGTGKSPFSFRRPCALIIGGETVVHLRGNGKGGRNQELALSASIGIQGIPGVLVFSFGSDGTDGPTDAAGGMVDGTTVRKLRDLNISAQEFLSRNDAYTALTAVNGLIKTGPTGTNINDVAVVLLAEEL